MLGTRVSGALRPRAASAISTVVDPEARRTWFIFASLATIVVVLAVPDRMHSRALVVSALLLALLTGIASAMPAFWPALNRFGGVLLAGQVAVLISGTGGATSPFGGLYAVLLVYAGMFYPTRRLVVTGTVLLVLYLGPHALSADTLGPGHWPRVVADLGVWTVITSVVHGLMGELRTRIRNQTLSEQSYRALFDQNPDGVFSMDLTGRITSVNAAACALVGAPASAMVGRRFHEFVALEEEASARQTFLDVLGGESGSRELTVVRADGREIDGALTGFPIVVDGQVTGVHTVLKDVTELKALQQNLSRQALHDPLTGVANRTLLADRYGRAVAAAARTGRPMAVLVIDLDGFKPVNDTHGHTVGDAVLVEVAARITLLLRPHDTLARLGGDEFAVVLPEADAEVADAVADRIRTAVSRPITVDGHHLLVTASVGTAIGGAAPDDLSGLLERADRAMYAAKHA